MTGSYVFPRVQVIPQIGRASLCIDGVERVGYEFGEGPSRPFLFPLVGPSGAVLTRLGHPNPIGHEHHKSIWFGHGSVGGINFWEERPNTDIRIRHRSRAAVPGWARLGGPGRRTGLVGPRPGDPAPGTDDRDRARPDSTAIALDLQSRFDSPDGSPVELGTDELWVPGCPGRQDDVGTVRRRAT